jgi:hypothetical protein
MHDPNASTEWNEFKGALESAFQEFRKDPDERSWAVSALSAVHLLVVKSALQEHRLFSILIEALVDLETGTVAPILQPRNFNHRPPDSLQRRLLKIRAAVAIDLLMESGLRRQAAATKVANTLDHLSLRITKKRKLTRLCLRPTRHVSSVAPIASS